MKVKVRSTISNKVTTEEVELLFRCQHVEDSKLYPSFDMVEFDESSEYLLVENNNSPYGFSALWLVDRKKKIYEWSGFGHSGAASVICALLQEVVALRDQLNWYYEQDLTKYIAEG